MLKINITTCFILLAAIVVTASCVDIGAEATKDPSAIPKEKMGAYSEKLFQIKRGMNRAEVRAIMGEPGMIRGVADVWYPEKGYKKNQIKVLYMPDAAVSCTWISVKDKVHFIHFR